MSGPPPQTPTDPAEPRSIDAILADYQSGYVPARVPGEKNVGLTPDGGIIKGNAYVAERDPLKALVSAGGAIANVCLGVDPGTFFCGGQAKLLADLKATLPGMTTGFIHVPPDRQTEPTAAGLPGRAENYAMMAQVLGRSVRGLVGGHGVRALLVTGFGAFKRVMDNPTQGFVQTPDGGANRGNMDQVMLTAFGPESVRYGRPMILEDGRVLGYHYPLATGSGGLTLFSGCLHLATDTGAALRGEYYPSMSPVVAQFNALLDQVRGLNGGQLPQAVISLGVDSTQLELAPGQTPSFRIETQAQGFFQEAPDPGFSALPVANFDLARLWLQGATAAP